MSIDLAMGNGHSEADHGQHPWRPGLRYLDPGIAEAVRHGRINRGWSYRQAERKTGVSAGHLCRLEHGQRVPSVAVAELLIDQFHLCGPIVDQLLEVAVSDAGRSRKPGPRPRPHGVTSELQTPGQQR